MNINLNGFLIACKNLSSSSVFVFSTAFLKKESITNVKNFLKNKNTKNDKNANIIL